MGMRGAPIVIFGLLLAATMTGCATEKKKEEVNLFWPLPPDPPRIKYVKSFSDSKEVLPPKGFFKKAISFFFGEDEKPKLIHPYGLSVGAQGKIFITDTELQVVHLFDYSAQVYRQFFRIPGGRLTSPVGIAVDSEHNLYVSDSELGRIFQYKTSGAFVKVWETPFKRPTGIAIDQERKVLYVVDTAEHHVLVFNLNGEKVSEFGKRGDGEGEFNFPTHIAVNPGNGDVYVSDSMNFRIEQFTSQGKFIKQIGSSGYHIGNFSKLKGIAVDSRGLIYAVDGLYDTVQIFNEKGEFLLNFGKAGNHEGEFWLPAGIAVFQDSIYVADSYNQRVQVFQLIDPSDPNGVLK